MTRLNHWLFLASLMLVPMLSNGNKADSLLNALSFANETEKLEIYKELSKAYFPGNLDEAYSVNCTLIKLAKKNGDTESVLFGLNELGAIYNFRGQYDSLTLNNADLLKKALAVKNEKYIAKSYANMAIALERSGSLDSAVYYNKKALSSPGIIRNFIVYNNLGRVLARQNNFNEAIQAYQKAIEFAAKDGDLNAEAVIANNVGTLFNVINNDSLAVYYFNKSIELKKVIGDKRGQLYAMLNLVVRPNIDSTTYINLLLSGLQIAKEEEEERFDAIFTAMLCELSHPSLDCPNELFAHYDNFKDEPSFEFPFVLQAMAKHYSDQREYTRATQYAQEYLNLAEEQNSLDDIQVARSTLLGIYSKTNNKSNYFDLAQAYYATQDSIDQSMNLNAFAYLQGELDREKNERISSLNASLELEERSTKRIILLSLAIAVLLIIFLVNRVRLIKSQKTLLHQKQESANYLEKMNEVLKEQQAFKDRFYSNITHEFKTPLTVIQGSIQQLQMDEGFLDLLKDDVQLANKFAAIQRNGTNLMGMVNQFLDLSKLDEKALSLDLKEGDLSGYIYYLGESFESHFEDQKIDFEIETSEGSVLTAYDADKVKQILSNLLSNAAKYTPKGGKVRLSLLADEEHYSIRVSDNGVGIANEHLPLVFDRYYRVQQGQMTEGTGIGLALCKELSEFMGGGIEVESTLGIGTSFKVHLPILKLVPNEALEHLDSVVSSSSFAEDKAHVLVIEDNREVANFIVSCIENEYNYTLTRNGEEGVEAALSMLPDLIITDVSMPIKDGFEVCAELKSNELTSHIPIVMLTALSSQESKLKGLEKGADEYLAKPFDLRELLLKIQNLIDLSSSLRRRFQESEDLRSRPSGLGAIDQAFLDKVYDVIEANIDNSQLGVEFVAGQVGISAAHLNRKLKSITNSSTTKFILAQKLKFAKQLLLETDTTVSEAAYQSGFNSVAYFIKCFRETFGETPGTYLKSN